MSKQISVIVKHKGLTLPGYLNDCDITFYENRVEVLKCQAAVGDIVEIGVKYFWQILTQTQLDAEKRFAENHHQCTLEEYHQFLVDIGNQPGGEDLVVGGLREDDGTHFPIFNFRKLSSDKTLFYILNDRYIQPKMIEYELTVKEAAQLLFDLLYQSYLECKQYFDQYPIIISYKSLNSDQILIMDNYTTIFKQLQSDINKI